MNASAGAVTNNALRCPTEETKTPGPLTQGALPIGGLRPELDDHELKLRISLAQPQERLTPAPP